MEKNLRYNKIIIYLIFVFQEYLRWYNNIFITTIWKISKKEKVKIEKETIK